MNPSIIRFHHFATVESYCKLQEIFGAFDERRNFESIKEPIKDFEITYYERDELFKNDTYCSLSFKNDFLIPGILKLKNQYFQNFKLACYKKGLFSEELLDGFAKHHRNNLMSMKKTILKADYLEFRIKGYINTELCELEKLIDNFILNPYPEIKEKLQFNWSRTDIEYFFYLLRENKEISSISDGDLGRIIDSTCEFKNKNDYLPINKSRKHLNEFKNTAARSTNNSNDRLKKIFMNKDFFSH